MTEENSGVFETWEEVIVDFFEHKIQKCKLFKAREYIEKKEKEIEKEKDEKKLLRAIKAKEKKQKEYDLLRKNAPSTEIRQWISETSNKTISVGKRIIKATHILKFTHSSSEPEGLLSNTKSNDLLLSTASLKKDLKIDLAHNNGNLITISRFLALFLKGDQIIDLIFNDDFFFLKPFASDVSQLKEWQNGFKNLVEKRDIRTADKAKQIYFPITSHNSIGGSRYHIVVPLFPSSLTNEIDSVVTSLKYGDEQKEFNKNRKEKLPRYRKGISKELPNMSILQFGGEHPKNVSMLNADRSGKSFLFSAQPPFWKNQLNPPFFKFSFFDTGLAYRTKESVSYLRSFLLRFQKIDLGIRDPKKKKWIDGWVNNILEEIFLYAASIQNLPAGWSNTENIKLKQEHQFFLDPYRDDEIFLNARRTTDWQSVICNDFANWLNGRIKGKDKKFTPQREHTRIWKEIMKKELREYTQVIDAEAKFRSRGQQT